MGLLERVLANLAVKKYTGKIPTAAEHAAIMREVYGGKPYYTQAEIDLHRTQAAARAAKHYATHKADIQEKRRLKRKESKKCQG